MDTTVTQHSLADPRSESETPVWCVSLALHPDSALWGNRAPLHVGAPHVIGRKENWLGLGAFSDSRISREHARLEVDDAERLWLHDLGSRNGTTVNEVPIERAELRSGDVIQAGSVLLVVQQGPRHFRVPRHADMIGRSWALADLLDQIERVAPLPATVLVQGETGTGKELVARALHRASGRRGSLHAVNCGGMPDALLQSELFGHSRGAFSGAERDRVGLFEAADAGTLFLDEIGDASAALQVSLLRVLQEGEVRRLGSNHTQKVDVRVVAATHVPLDGRVQAGAFREDLLARLSQWVLRVPPLRERGEDIPLLAAHFARKATGRDWEWHPRLMTALLRCAWPRNVRQLEAVVQRAAIEGGRGPLHLTARVEAALAQSPLAQAGPAQAGPLTPGARDTAAAAGSSAPSPPDRPAKEGLDAALRMRAGVVRAVAKDLGVSRNTLYRWMKEDGLDPTDYRDL